MPQVRQRSALACPRLTRGPGAVAHLPTTLGCIRTGDRGVVSTRFSRSEDAAGCRVPAEHIYYTSCDSPEFQCRPTPQVTDANEPAPSVPRKARTGESPPRLPPLAPNPPVRTPCTLVLPISCGVRLSVCGYIFVRAAARHADVIALGRGAAGNGGTRRAPTRSREPPRIPRAPRDPPVSRNPALDASPSGLQTPASSLAPVLSSCVRSPT